MSQRTRNYRFGLFCCNNIEFISCIATSAPVLGKIGNKEHEVRALTRLPTPLRNATKYLPTWNVLYGQDLSGGGKRGKNSFFYHHIPRQTIPGGLLSQPVTYPTRFQKKGIRHKCLFRIRLLVHLFRVSNHVSTPQNHSSAIRV